MSVNRLVKALNGLVRFELLSDLTAKPELSKQLLNISAKHENDV